MVAQPTYASASVASSQRFTSDDHCPSCGGYQRGRGADHCYGYWLRDGDGWVCTQCSSPHPCAEGWLHWRDTCRCGENHDGAAPQANKTPKPPITYPARKYLPANVLQDGENYRYVSEGEYYDAAGVLLHIERRYEQERPAPGVKPVKTARYFSPLPDGTWVNRRIGAPVLWNLPALMTAPIDAPIYVVEGWRKAQYLQAALQVAGAAGVVTSAKSAPELVNLEVCGGYRLICIPDNDEAGEHHMATVVKRALPIAGQVCYLRLPDLPHKGDVVDYLVAHTAGDLVRLANMATPVAVTPAPEPTPEQTSSTPENVNSSRMFNLNIPEITLETSRGPVAFAAAVNPIMAVDAIVAEMAPRDANKVITYRNSMLTMWNTARDNRDYANHVNSVPNKKLRSATRRYLIALSEIRREREPLTRPDDRDAEGRLYIPNSWITERAGISSSQGSQCRLEAEKAGIIRSHKTSVRNADGDWETRIAFEDGPNAAIDWGGVNLPDRDKDWGGFRLQKIESECPTCGSDDITIKAEVVCHNPECATHGKPQLSVANTWTDAPTRNSSRMFNLNIPEEAATQPSDATPYWAPCGDTPLHPSATTYAADVCTPSQRPDSSPAELASALTGDPRADLLALVQALGWPRIPLDPRGVASVGPGADIWRRFVAIARVDQLRAALDALPIVERADAAAVEVQAR